MQSAKLIHGCPFLQINPVSRCSRITSFPGGDRNWKLAQGQQSESSTPQWKSPPVAQHPHLYKHLISEMQLHLQNPDFIRPRQWRCPPKPPKTYLKRGILIGCQEQTETALLICGGLDVFSGSISTCVFGCRDWWLSCICSSDIRPMIPCCSEPLLPWMYSEQCLHLITSATLDRCIHVREIQEGFSETRNLNELIGHYMLQGEWQSDNYVFEPVQDWIVLMNRIINN